MKTQFTILIIISLFFISCQDKPKITPSKKIVKIGVLAPLSGKYVKLGHQSLLGLKAANKMNKYLSNGDEIVFIQADTKSLPSHAVEATNKLIKNNVKVIFSFVGSTQMLTLKESLKKVKVPIISTIAADDNITNDNPYLTQVCINNNKQALVASHYILDEKFIENVGVVYNTKSSYSSSMAQKFNYYFKKLGGNVVFSIDMNTPNAVEKFQKQNKEKIKMLFNLTDASTTLKLLNSIKKENNEYKILLSNGFISSAMETNKESLEEFNGMYIIEHYAEENSPNNERKNIQNILKKKSFKESSFSLLAYDGYQLLLYALEHCSYTNYDEQCVNSLLQNSDIIQGVSGNFSTQNAKVKREVFVNKIEKLLLKKEVVIY